MNEQLIRQLEERRAALVGQMETLLQAPTTENRELTTEEQTSWDAAQADVTRLDEQLTRFRDQRDREARAAAARAGDPAVVDNGQGGSANGRHEVRSEPTVYGRGAGHSYFLDEARIKLNQAGLYEGSGDGGVRAAEERMRRHNQELDVDLPKRWEARERAASRAYEEAFAGNRHERRALARMQRQGVSPFERRALTRTDGQGGYFVPPTWLVDEYIPYLRAGREFVDLWRNLPLPHGTDSINIPRVTLGSGVGSQPADGGPVANRDMTDNFVNALVRTVAGQMDVAIQLLDQSPIAFDELIFGDLAEDYNLQLDGQALLGSGTNGQVLGVWPSGAIGAANAITVSNTNNANTSPQTWINGGTVASPGSVAGSVFQTCGQLLSFLQRKRLKPPTHWVWHPWIWYMLTTTVDSQLRPLVVPGTPNNMAFNQAAVDTDGPVEQGPVGYYMGLPVILDPNIPTTFGGATAPSLAQVSAGNFATTPGNGLYTPILAGRWNDLYLWEGEVRTRTLSEVLSGTLQVRFQLYNYLATMPNRFQAYATESNAGTYTTTAVNSGSAIAYGSLVQQQSNGILQITAQGF